MPRSHRSAVALAALACTAFVLATGPATAAPRPADAATADPVIAATGDTAGDPDQSNYNGGNGTSSACKQLATSNMIASDPAISAVLALGDIQNDCGRYRAYLQAFALSWCRCKAKIHPIPGNHEYLTSGGTDCASTDGRSSWTHGFLTATTPDSTPAGAWARTSDASVAFDAKHGVWIVSYLGLFPNGNTSEVDVLVSRSTDGGLTWSNPVVVNADGDFNDKNWTTCDNHPSSPFYGHCYTEFDDNTLGDRIEMSTSSDGGVTWGSKLETANTAAGIGGQPVVQPSGRVIVPINGFAGQNFLVLSFTSDNGGASWSKTHIVTRVGFHHAAGGIRDSIPLPSADINASGKVFVVWQDCHFEPGCNASDIVLSTSTDGVKWSKLSRIPLDPRGSGVDHFFPGLAVRGKRLALAYYCYPNANCTTATCQLNVGFASSSDGGSSWSASSHLAGPMFLDWLPNTSQGTMVGDDISTSFAGTRAFPAFALANAPTGTTFDEATYTIQGGLGIAAAANAVSDQVNAGGTATLTTSAITDQ